MHSPHLWVLLTVVLLLGGLVLVDLWLWTVP